MLLNRGFIFSVFCYPIIWWQNLKFDISQISVLSKTQLFLLNLVKAG